jgi:DNA-binding NtrC family response regulator
MQTRKSILVCEDDAVQQRVLVAALKQAGYEARAARNPAEALLQVRARVPDAVLADVQLEQGSAFDLLRSFRRSGMDAPVIMMSAYATSTMQDRALAAGAASFFEKPCDLKDVIGSVRAAVAERRAPKLGLRVLLADEHAGVRFALERGLLAAGFDVVTASDAPRALEEVRSAIPAIDIAFVDIHLPGFDAKEVISEMRRAQPGLYVAMTTGDATPDEIHAGYQAGASTLVRKPIAPDRFADYAKTLAGAARDRRLAAEKAAREAADPWHRHLVRWAKSYGSAPRGSVRRRRFQAALAGAAAVVVAVFAAGAIDATIAAMDECKAKADRVLEVAAERLGDGPSAEAAFQQWLMIQQLQMGREANEATQRYYDQQMELQRMQGFRR